jgi:hypothetical protein
LENPRKKGFFEKKKRGIPGEKFGEFPRGEKRGIPGGGKRGIFRGQVPRCPSNRYIIRLQREKSPKFCVEVDCKKNTIWEKNTQINVHAP